MNKMLSLISKKLSTVLKVIGGVLVAGALVFLGIFVEKKNHEKKVDQALPNIFNSMKGKNPQAQTINSNKGTENIEGINNTSPNDQKSKDRNLSNTKTLNEKENTNSSTDQVSEGTKTLPSSKDNNLLKSVIVNLWDKKEKLEKERDIYKNAINGILIAQQYTVTQEQYKNNRV